MKLPIDWSSAPEGATHYCMYPATTYKWLRDSPLSYYDEYLDKWVKYTSDIGATHLPNSVENPIKTWDGVGRPPVGTVCEYLKHAKYKTSWIKVKVVFIGENLIVFKHGASGNEFSEQIADVSFRPIKTPEQIAAEERLHAIEEMIELVAGDSSFNEVMSILYDAGYRKVEK